MARGMTWTSIALPLIICVDTLLSIDLISFQQQSILHAFPSEFSQVPFGATFYGTLKPAEP